jgi:hypothetical protein
LEVRAGPGAETNSFGSTTLINRKEYFSTTGIGTMYKKQGFEKKKIDLFFKEA